MKTFFQIILMLLASVTVALAQQGTEARSIYDAIEYRTPGYADIQATWIITDPILIREIFDRCLSRGALTLNSQKISAAMVTDRSQAIHEGRVGILCRQRYFDSNLERLQFILLDSPTLFLDPIPDRVYLADVLGDVYPTILKKDYVYRDITKELYDSKQRYYYDIDLGLLQPEVMFWSTTTNSSLKNRWFLSAFGRFGNDQIDLPFWFKGTLTGGMKLTYLNNVGINDRSYSKSSFALGWEEPVNFSFGNPSGRGAKQIFKSPLLVGTSSNIAGDFTMSSDYDDASWVKYRRFSAYVSFPVLDKDKYPASVPNQFYSIRNSVGLSYELRHVDIAGSGNIFDGLAGISWHDIHQYDQSVTPVKEFGETKNNFIPFIGVGVSSDGDLLRYEFGTQLHYNMSEGYGYAMFSTLLMLSNTVGIDFRYFKALSKTNLPAWQYDNYLVISPLLRINY